MSKGKQWDFRDICKGLQIIREFLLGRKHTLHGRFPPLISPRTIPPPQIPRGPEYKYSAQYYCDRNARDSVKPPVIAPIAEGPCWPSDPTKKAQPGGMRADAMTFNSAPMPGHPWWWDGHCYYECVPDPPARNCPPPSAPCPPAECPKPPKTC